MKRKYFRFLLSAFVCVFLLCFAAFADGGEIVFTMPAMELDLSNPGGRSFDRVAKESNEEETVFKVNGNLNGQGPALFFYNLDVDADSYDYIRMVAKIDLDNKAVKNHAFLFKTENFDFSEDRRAFITIDHESDGYVEYIFDFSKHPQWKGKITALYYGLYGDAKGEIRIKTLEFVDGVPEETQSNDSGSTENESNNSGVVFTMPPMELDMSNPGGRNFDKVETTDEGTVFKLNGYLNGQGPALFFYNLDVDADSYDYIRMVAKIELDNKNVKNHAFLFHTEALGFSEDRRAFITIDHESDGYVE
ncbi:MAG: hypothetical protein IJZ20_02195, partial [Clostridia bacterium]|nr:hypothetical protein [Clostridia bacterium]